MTVPGPRARCGSDAPLISRPTQIGYSMTRAFAAALLGLLLLAPEAALAAQPLDGAAMRWPWALPFAGILLSIATGPLLFPRIWHRHYGTIAFVWSALTLAPLAVLQGGGVAFAAFLHAILAEYLSFIVLLF